MSQRFTRAMRLVRESGFKRVYSQGSRARGAWITVVAAPNDLGELGDLGDLGKPRLTRLGLSVGKRYDKRAVRRNAWKRRLREAFRLSYSQLPPGHDLVVVASEPGARASLPELQAELVKLALKAARRWQERNAPPLAATQAIGTPPGTPPKTTP